MANVKSIGGNPIVLDGTGIADNSVEAKHIKDGEVNDDKLSSTGIKKTVADHDAAISGLIDVVSGTVNTVSDWGAIARAASNDLVGIQVVDKLKNPANVSTVYDNPWDIVDYKSSVGLFLEMHHCLPDGTEFSPRQAFLCAIDAMPAATYNVTFSSKMGDRQAGTYQFTLTQELPAGGQMTGFDNYSGNTVKTYASSTSTTAIESVTVTEGSGGTSLGTFTVAGAQAVPASGTPASNSTVTIDGTTYRYYGLNSVQRVAYGNNRVIHSALYQWLNSALASGWWVPKTVFDRPPSYANWPGFLTLLSEDMVAHLKTVTRTFATSYAVDGGTASSPETDTMSCKVFLPSWEEQFLAVSNDYGAQAGLEGTAWEYWKRAKGTQNPPAAGTTNTEYIRTKINDETAAHVWLGSVYRGSGRYVACVTSSGLCGGNSACSAFRVAPACVIEESE